MAWLGLARVVAVARCRACGGPARFGEVMAVARRRRAVDGAEPVPTAARRPQVSR